MVQIGMGATCERVKRDGSILRACGIRGEWALDEEAIVRCAGLARMTVARGLHERCIRAEYV